ncbi:MAG TPA: hypothetical protein VIF62_37550 [Labilithrix sp.]|jgi:hypothetical protein
MIKRPFGGVVVGPTVSVRDMAAAEKAVLADPAFQEIVSRLANLVVCWNNQEVPRSEPVPPGLARQALEVAARVALVACSEHAGVADLELARAAVEVAWKKITPVVVKNEDEYADKLAPRAEAWQIALNKIFEQQTFMKVLAQDGLESLSAPKARVAVVAHILEQLASSGAPLPTRLDEAARRVGSSLSDLPPELRERVERAAAFVASLALEDEDGNVALRIAWEKLGGRGSGRKLKPWRAAFEFADAFGVPMPERLHDVTREK